MSNPLIDGQKAWGSFLIGVLLLAIVPLMFPTMFEVFGDLNDGGTLVGIVEFGLIVIQTALIVIIPLGIIGYNLVTQNEENKPLAESWIAVVILLFGLLLTYLMYGWVTAFASVMEGTFAITLFWIGLIVTWFGTIVVLPLNHIIKSSKVEG